MSKSITSGPGLSADKALFRFLQGANDPAVEIFCRDMLNGTSGMGNQLKYARTDAAELRRKADEIENRAVQNLVDDIMHEWKPIEVLSAVNRLKEKQ